MSIEDLLKEGRTSGVNPAAAIQKQTAIKKASKSMFDTKAFFAKDKASMKATQGAALAASMGMQAMGIGGEGDHSDIGNTASGAVSGFSAGMQTGNPHIAVAGAVVGGLAGLSGAGGKRKEAAAKAKAQAEAQHQSNMVSIEGEKGRKIQGALTRMGAAFSKNLKEKDKPTRL
jgi:hypothetical protein